MANTTETVFVEFVVDDSQIETAQQTLQRTGQVDKQAADQFKKTNAELARRQQTIDNLNKQLKSTQDQNAKTIADMEARMETFIKDFVEGFSEGIVDTLKEAGLEFDEFGKIINKNNEATSKGSKGLRGELKALNVELAQMKLRGEDNTQQYRELAQRAGEIKDAIGDAAQEINNFASDTSKLDGAIQAAQGLAGAFAVAQGSIGLFAGENEKLNEVMLKVNSAIAVLQGLQTVGQVIQKESAAATFLNTTAQQLYNIVVGESIGLLKGLRIAFAATGVGAVILGLTALVMWMQRSGKATEKLTEDFQKFNFETAHAQEELNKAVAQGTRTLQENQAQGKARGAQQSDLTKQEIDDLKSTFDAVFDLERAQRARAATARETLTQMATGEREFNKDLADAAQETIDNFVKTQEKRADIASEIRVKTVENEKQIQLESLQAIADGVAGRLALARKNSEQELQLAKESARANAAIELAEAGENTEKRLLIQRQLQAKIRELNAEFARVQAQDAVTAAELELEKITAAREDVSTRQSQQEIDAQKKVIQEKARLDLLATGLTEEQKTAIRERSLAEQLKIQKEFNKQATEDALKDQIDRNNKLLANVNISEEEKLRLTEENLIVQAQIEKNAALGQADTIKAIDEQLNADLRAARLQSLQKTLADELSLTESQTGALRRANERIVADQNKSLHARIDAINQLTELQLNSIGKQEAALEESLQRGLISQQEYDVKYAALIDKQVEIVEQGEAKKLEAQKQQILKSIDFAVQTAQQVTQLVADFGKQQTDREQQRIDEQRAQIDALKEAGAITEKEAAARQKKLDAEENALKRKQAQRDKAIAIFQAIINTAAAVAKALLTGGPVYAAIVGALGAAQIALIASKPIPKFGKGKKNNYEGPAQIGETGPELWQHNGDMYLAKKSAVVWVGARDRVYNPRETVAMMESMQPYVVKDAETNKYTTITNNTTIDYDKLGEAVGRHLPQLGLSIDNTGAVISWAIKGNSFAKYLDTRRGYK